MSVGLGTVADGLLLTLLHLVVPGRTAGILSCPYSTDTTPMCRPPESAPARAETNCSPPSTTRGVPYQHVADSPGQNAQRRLLPLCPRPLKLRDSCFQR